MDSNNSEALRTFLNNTSSGFAEVINKLNILILSTDERFQSSIKWNRLTYAVNEDFHHWICALNITKKSVGFILHFGGLLNDEKGLLTKGTSRFLRKIEFDDPGKIDTESIQSLLVQAIEKLPYFIKNWKSISREGKSAMQGTAE